MNSIKSLLYGYQDYLGVDVMPSCPSPLPEIDLAIETDYIYAKPRNLDIKWELSINHIQINLSFKNDYK